MGEAGTETEESVVSNGDLAKAYDLLQELLRDSGAVSSTRLRRELEKRLGVDDGVARQLVVALKYINEDPERPAQIGRPDARTFHHGWNFHSEADFKRVLENTEKEAQDKEEEAEQSSENQTPLESEGRKNRREEARVGTYVKAFLENIYGSDFVPDDGEYVFDVHNERPGSSYENIDLLAVHWRSEVVVDLVSVEVKLWFSPDAVHQACNYLRFSHRAWVAVCVTADASEAAMELRGIEPGLFDYAVSRGIGIIGCRRTKGRSYDIFPLHWPSWHDPEPVEKEMFLERYRSSFETACVIETKKKRMAARV